MGFFSWLFGSSSDDRYSARDYGSQPGAGQGMDAGAGQSGQPRSEDDIALERYRYLLRTAPPEQIEAVHEEAFAKLTPDQRRQLFQELSERAPVGDAPRADDPRSLAQAATRAEIRRPGTLEQTMAVGMNRPGQQGYGQQAYGQQGYGGGMMGGSGFGSTFGSTMLGTVAGYVVGSAIMHSFLPPMGFGYGGEMYADGFQDGNAGDGGGDWTSSDGGFRDGGGDGGGAVADGGGDWGGGGFDFSGGDIGGDFG
ncbi:hypothetical protein USB125703_00240 [Pseudoclavibacter triregionum]|nr:hypothetical protein USB125703_00240 [Pseudoclavibacter triregionum]